MQKAKVIEEVFQMRFNDIYSKFRAKKLNCKEAAKILRSEFESFLQKPPKI